MNQEWKFREGQILKRCIMVISSTRRNGTTVHQNLIHYVKVIKCVEKDRTWHSYYTIQNIRLAPEKEIDGEPIFGTDLIPILSKATKDVAKFDLEKEYKIAPFMTVEMRKDE